MLALACDLDTEKPPSHRARLSHRLAMHLPVAPIRLASATPLLSLTFDDAPETACTKGADLLEAHGGQGTYYIAGGLIGRCSLHWQLASEGRIVALRAAGHEIGCHTHGHAFLPHLSAAGIRAEALHNRDRLRAILPDLRIENFAYPFGYASLTAKRVLSRYFTTGRSIAPGVNHGRVDSQFLRANPLIDGRMDLAKATSLLDAAAACNGWLIFYGHDVANDPSPYGCTPRLLDAVLRAATDRGFASVTIAEGLRRSLPRPDAMPAKFG